MTDSSLSRNNGNQSLPYIPDMTPAERIGLQLRTASDYTLEPVFHDAFQDLSGQGPKLTVIPAGIFTLGSPAHEFGHRREETPERYTCIYQAFAMGVLPVTADEFAVFQQDTGFKPLRELIWNKDQQPVINIRYAEAKLYLQWLSEKTGQTYRLPTESEWEYAARAGSETPFHFGESVSCREVNFNASYPYQEMKEEKRWFLPRCFPAMRADRTGDKPANHWGLHDVHGCVWEMTSSSWNPTHLSNDASDRKRIVTKGGSWFDAAVRARSASRMPRLRDEMDTNLGFRVVREL